MVTKQRLTGVITGVCGILLVIAALGRLLMIGTVDSYAGPAAMALLGVAFTWVGLMLIGKHN